MQIKKLGTVQTVPISILYYFFKDSTKTSTSVSISSRFTLLVDEVNPTFSFKTVISFTWVSKNYCNKSPDFLAQEPFSTIATVLFCKFNALISITKLCITG